MGRILRNLFEKKSVGFTQRKFSTYFCLVVLALSSAGASQTRQRLAANHVPTSLLKKFNAVSLGAVDPGTPMSLRIPMPLRNPAGLQSLIKQLYDPGDPLYHQYLTPEQFNARFAPAASDVAAMADYLSNNGFQVQISPSQLLIRADASAATVQSTFNIEIQNYMTADNRIVSAPTQNPEVPTYVAGLVSGVIGLTKNLNPRRAHMRARNSQTLKPAIGNGFGGTGMIPSDIKTAYSLASTSLTGAGQTLALVELDGYAASDIAAYATQFGLPTPNLTNVLVGGYNGAAFVGSGEVTLDIEMALALAPNLKIMVYEAPATDAGFLDIFDRIANDNLAKVISNSWGSTEDASFVSLYNSENTALQKMAAQGQSFFSASGDSGAYDAGSSNGLLVEDPCSQPYDTCVGGTSLTLSAGVYSKETSWANDPAGSNDGGGGGISKIWSIAQELNTYQSGLGTVTNQGSTTMRMVPDVALDSDPQTGYSIYGTSCGFTCKCTGAITSGANQNCSAGTSAPGHAGWYGFGGTSAAAPLWAAFTALVNQQIAMNTGNNNTTVGFLNATLYPIAKGAAYATNFHDIADSSTNLFYPAVTGYDLSTGWGSFNGGTFLTTLATAVGGAVVTNSVPNPPTGLTVEAVSQ